MSLTNGNPLSDKYHKEFMEKIRDIRERESVTRDVRARKMAEELNEERKKLGNPSPRAPVLVCSKMKHLPPAADYLKPEKTDVD